MEISITREQYLKLIGTLLELKSKEVDILLAMVNNNTTNRNEIADILKMDNRVISNYKSVLVKKKLIKDDLINAICLTNKFTLNVSN